MMVPLDRVGMNQATTRLQWGFRESVEGYSRHGIRHIGVWRDKIAKVGLATAKAMLADNGMSVTALNRAGPFDLGVSSTAQVFYDAREAIDDAAGLGAECLMVFLGGLSPGSKDMAAARARNADVLADLLPVARSAGVTLALEPLHPMLAADRSCMCTMKEANDLCDALGPGLGIVVDVYHVWWDPDLEAETARAAGGRILGFHVSDWLVPTRNLLTDRGMMGDGIIDLPVIRSWVEAAGYRGPVEVEIFSADDWWKRDPNEVVKISIERCKTEV